MRPEDRVIHVEVESERREAPVEKVSPPPEYMTLYSFKKSIPLVIIIGGAVFLWAMSKENMLLAGVSITLIVGLVLFGMPWMEKKLNRIKSRHKIKK